MTDNETGVATLYNGAGVRDPLVVTVSAPGGGDAAPTGEVFNGGGSPGYYDAIPPVGNNGTVLVRVYRKAGQPLTCQSYTLQVSK